MQKLFEPYVNSIPQISFVSKHDENHFEFFDLKDFFKRTKEFTDHSAEKPHKLSFYALILVTKGLGKHKVDLKECSLEPGVVVKVSQGQIHAFQDTPTYEGYLIVFTESFLLNYFSSSSIDLISSLYNYHLQSPIAHNSIDNDILIKQLSEELENDNDYARKNIIAKYLELYLLKLERRTGNVKLNVLQSEHYLKFIQFKSLLENKFHETRNVLDYTNWLNISNNSLNQIVKQFTNCTSKAFIDSYVILEAKRQIISTDKSIKEVAFSLGFDEVTNFTKFFKKNVGVTPGSYRKKQML